MILHDMTSRDFTSLELFDNIYTHTTSDEIQARGLRHDTPGLHLAQNSARNHGTPPDIKASVHDIHDIHSKFMAIEY